MDIQSKAHALMAAVGPALDLLAVDEYEAEGMWHIAIDENSILFAEIDRVRGVLVLSADVGTPNAADRAPLYGCFLQYNHFWDSTYGMRLSVESPDGACWLIADVAIDSMDVEAFGARLKNFAEKAAGWRAIVAKFGTGAKAGEEVPSLLGNLIRG